MFWDDRLFVSRLRILRKILYNLRVDLNLLATCTILEYYLRLAVFLLSAHLFGQLIITVSFVLWPVCFISPCWCLERFETFSLNLFCWLLVYTEIRITELKSWPLRESRRDIEATPYVLNISCLECLVPWAVEISFDAKYSMWTNLFLFTFFLFLNLSHAIVPERNSTSQVFIFWWSMLDFYLNIFYMAQLICYLLQLLFCCCVSV